MFPYAKLEGTLYKIYLWIVANQIWLQKTEQICDYESNLDEAERLGTVYSLGISRGL
jgi:hypothetical protein